ncbi:hypothetical protein EG328_004016 [Venturia inaequalis]|uniref:Uncharacterized protein n=1 Tax=Venturia inaequalis TaxID=5025 RepID=A0A8H3YZ32_VENIN|nr:hypothetical protein EG328_004016 [Venturia inaequalis]KAE9994827.1 hypothetical protein EG327_000040 [Venturia inaequalis]
MAPSTTTTPNLGYGTKEPQDFNNAGFLALFAILGTGMVLVSIYFFFVAKNGGFRWQGKKDWDDYKSTVLRRKGPNGTTLSNATKSTKLGGGSVVPKWAKTEYTRSSESSYDPKEMRDMEDGNAHKGRRDRDYRKTSRNDTDLRAYKHEKAAKVGGINTSHHGSQWDHTNTDRSEVSAPPLVSKKEKQAAAKEEKERKQREKERKQREKAELKQQEKDQAAREKEEKKKARKNRKGGSTVAESTVGTEVSEVTEPLHPERIRRVYPSGAYSFHQGDDGASVAYTATNTASDAPTRSSARQSSYYEAYRPSAQVPPIREQPTPVSSHHSEHRRSANNTPRASRDSLHQSRTRDSPSHSRQSSPRKQHRSRPSTSEYTAASSDSGTKVYSHHIPGVSLTEPGPQDSVSQVGARPYQSRHVYPPAPQTASSSAGYRRGGRGRRDSLSDSEM